MLNLLRAEWKKVSGHRWLTGCLIWIWPAIGFVFLWILLAALMIDADQRDPYIENPPSVQEIASIAWAVPNNVLVRPFLLGFAAVLFAAEYENQTWKIIVPGNRRFQLILAKFIILSAFIVLAFSIMMSIMVGGVGIINLIVGAGYPIYPADSDALEFLGDLLLNITLTFVNILIIGSIAALVALWTRTILFGVLVSIFFVLMETLGLVLALLIISELFWKQAVDIYLLTPSYNTSNIFAWVNEGKSAGGLGEDVNTLQLGESIFVLATWVLSLIALSMGVFQRQDLK